jgi:hypothetical protein
MKNMGYIGGFCGHIYWTIRNRVPKLFEHSNVKPNLKLPAKCKNIYVLFKSNWMYNILFSCKVFCSKFFGFQMHPSSGAQL